MRVNQLRDMYATLAESFMTRFPLAVYQTEAGVHVPVWEGGRWFGFFLSQIRRGGVFPTWDQVHDYWPVGAVGTAYRDYWVGLTWAFQGRQATMLQALSSPRLSQRLGAVLHGHAVGGQEPEEDIFSSLSTGRVHEADFWPDLLDLLDPEREVSDPPSLAVPEPSPGFVSTPPFP